jgi:hypothetical protein
MSYVKFTGADFSVKHRVFNSYFRRQYTILIAIATIAPIIIGTITSVVPYFCIRADEEIAEIDTTIAIIMTNLLR